MLETIHKKLICFHFPLRWCDVSESTHTKMWSQNYSTLLRSGGRQIKFVSRGLTLWKLCVSDLARPKISDSDFTVYQKYNAVFYCENVSSNFPGF